MIEVLEMMQMHIALGLELDLYNPDELDSTMWYWDYLISAKLHVKGNLLHTKAMVESQAGRSGASSAGGAEQDDLRGDVYRTMARGMFRLLVGLERLGVIAKPNYEFITEERRYFHRLTAFHGVQNPPVLPYAKYTESEEFAVPDVRPMSTAPCGWVSVSRPTPLMGPESSARALTMPQTSPYLVVCIPNYAQPTLVTQSAIECFKRVKARCEFVSSTGTSADQFDGDELKQLKRVAVTNLVAIAQASRSVQAPAGTKQGAGGVPARQLKLDFATHPFFPIVSLA